MTKLGWDKEPKKGIRIVIARTYENLVQLKKEGNQAHFNEMLMEILPEVKNYINRRLSAAIHKGHFPKGMYTADDFVDQLFVEVYDKIGEVPNENDFYHWLFKRTNQLLEDVMVEEEFDEFFFKNIDDYSKPEWDALAEKVTSNLEGEEILMEDLEDVSYRKNDYVINDVFVEEDEDEWVENWTRN